MECAVINNLVDSEVLESATKVHLSKTRVCINNYYYCNFAASLEVALFSHSTFPKNFAQDLILKEFPKSRLVMLTMMLLKKMEENVDFGLQKE